jgi:GT2 family glycosyltransferase
LIIVDGASTDETARVLREAQTSMGSRLRVIREARREGFVRAANKGFAAARGRNMTWLNDDARPLPGALDRAVALIDAAPPGVGVLAMFHRCNTERNIACESIHRGQAYRLLHVRGTLYANFGIARRESFAKLDYFDERYFLNAADPDFSLKAWNAGLSVVPAEGVWIDHDEHDDARRAIDSERGRLDNEALFAKWDLPPKNLLRNDFDPAHPCTLRGLRPAMGEAA